MASNGFGFLLPFKAFPILKSHIFHPKEAHVVCLDHINQSAYS